LKTAVFTVHAGPLQSARWKQAADAAGHASVGSWLAEAADLYLHQLAKTGLPRPLAWHRGTFRAVLVNDKEREVRGWVSPPFGTFRGGVVAQKHFGPHTLVYLPTGRLLATFGTIREARALAAELAAVWVRWEGKEEPGQEAAAVLSRLAGGRAHHG
jgi:hypothetical protein